MELLAETLIQLLAESPLILTLVYLLRIEQNRFDDANHKLHELVPDGDSVVLPTSDLKAVNPDNAKNFARAAKGKPLDDI